MVHHRTHARRIGLYILSSLTVFIVGCVQTVPQGSAGIALGSSLEMGTHQPWTPDGDEWMIDQSSGIARGQSLTSVALNDTGNLGFAVGSGGVVLRWDGAGWKRDEAAIRVADGAMIKAIALDASGKQALAVGADGFMMSWNGSIWKRDKVAEKLSGGYSFFAVDIDAQGKSAWAVGQYGIALHRVGTKWVRTKTPYRNPGFVSGGAPVDVFGIWSVWIHPNGVDAIAGAHMSEVVRWNGSAWKIDKAATSQRADSNPFGGWTSIAMSRDGSKGWIVGSSNTLHWNGSKWLKDESDGDESLIAVATDAQGKLAFAVGMEGQIEKWNGTRWTGDTVGKSVAKKRYLQSVALNAAGNVGFAVGDQGIILRWDGQSWKQDPVSEKTSYAQFSAVAVSADGKTGLAVGSYGDYLRWDGTKWSTAGAANPKRLRIDCLWMSPAGDQAIGLSQDGIYHWDGSEWTAQPNGKTLMDLSISANGKFGFAVGFFGQIFRYDGSSWQLDKQGKSIAKDATFYAVAVNSEGNLAFAAGTDNFLRWDGNSWKKDAKLSKGSISSICLNAKGDLGFAAGYSYNGDSFFRWDGKQWLPDKEASRLMTDSGPYSLCLTPDGRKGLAVSFQGTVLVLERGKWHKDAEATRLVRGQYPISACIDAEGKTGWILGNYGFLMQYKAGN